MVIAVPLLGINCNQAEVARHSCIFSSTNDTTHEYIFFINTKVSVEH